MAYDDFCSRIRALVRKSGALVIVGFRHEDGKHIAICNDGTIITGNKVSRRVTVRWGSGHVATAVI